MKKVQYEFLLEATSPIAHHSEAIGNFSTLMRAKQRKKGGGFVDVPIVTADTMRHGIREAAAYAFLDAAGLLDGKPQLSEAALRLLFNGGMVTGKGDASVISLQSFQRACDLVPTLALLGGCSDSRVIPGRIQVQDATLVCREVSQRPWVEEWLSANDEALDSWRSHVEVPMRVRMDPMLDPGKRKLLSSQSAQLAEGKLDLSEQAHEEDDGKLAEETKSTIMPRSFERLTTGSIFHWSVYATTYSDLDVDTLHVALGSFLGRMQVGGKKGTGHGWLRAIPGAARNVDVLRPSEAMDVLELEKKRDVGALFREHVGTRKQEIAEWLAGVDA